MRAQRASALSVPNPANPAAVLAPRILPAMSATNAQTVTLDEGIKKSKKRNPQPRKKTVQRSKSTPKLKTAGRRTVKVKGTRTTTTTMHPPAVAAGLPQLVRLEKALAAANPAEITSTANPALTNSSMPMLALAEGKPNEIATLAGNEMSFDCSHGNEPCASDESNAPAEPTFALLEKPGLLEALSLQCTGLLRVLAQMWSWAQQKFKSHQVRKRLRVCETVSLGEKRFVAVIQVDGEQFLVGGSSSSVSTLAHLEPRPEFSEVFRTRCEKGVGPA